MRLDELCDGVDLCLPSGIRNHPERVQAQLRDEVGMLRLLALTERCECGRVHLE